MLLLVLLLDLARAVEVTIPLFKVLILRNKASDTYISVDIDMLLLPYRRQMIFVTLILTVAMQRVGTCTLPSQATLTF